MDKKLTQIRQKVIDRRPAVIRKAAEYVKKILDEHGLNPMIGIVLGSGLGKLADRIQDPVTIPYKDIPGFPVSTAMGHKGNFIIGTLGGKTVIAMQGRIHYYEGYGMDLVTLPIRVMGLVGIEYLLVSNAAGGINFDFRVGDLMIIKDHINLMPNPLIGPNMDDLGPRFPDMTHPYNTDLIKKVKGIAKELKINLREGVYIALTGPSYETPAEWHFFRTIGADAVGMSTVPEVIVARHNGIKVLGMSVITNAAQKTFSEDYMNDGHDVVKTADAAADSMTAIFEKLIETL
ncbi:MAG: purine nucleoside phosphorylase I, inosine and guanosine-specific [Bacteroidales bacterium]|nr:purine nucleoside phosphorylase I, inosine and guanosine-specific [Bacteroidales bacterium]